MREVNETWEPFWRERWENNRIGFHQAEVEIQLKQWLPSFSPTRVFVPLCGKTKDLLYFAELGHYVVGVEFNEMACEAFFVENAIPFTLLSFGDQVTYQSEKITIYCGDFFRLPATCLKGVQVVYDRAALIALPEEMRSRYTRHLFDLLAEGNSQPKTILLITIDYEPGTRKGPPFAVSETEVRKLYEPYFEVEQVSSEEDVSLSPGDSKAQSKGILEQVYLMHSK